MVNPALRNQTFQTVGALRVSAFALATALLASAASAASTSSVPARRPHLLNADRALYGLTLLDGRRAVVAPGGLARILSKDGTHVQTRVVPFEKMAEAVQSGDPAFAKKLLAITLSKDPPQSPFVSGRVIVVFQAGITGVQDLVTVPARVLQKLRAAKTATVIMSSPPSYTNSAAVNTSLALLGVDRSERLFARLDRGTLSMMHSMTRSSNGRGTIDFSNAYRLNVAGSSVQNAVAKLAKIPGVAYVSPDWRVTTMQSGRLRLPGAALQSAQRQARSGVRTQAANFTIATNTLPQNYTVTSSAQSMLNAPGNNALAAFDEIQKRFHTLPGQGQIVTNVSIGDLVYNPVGDCAQRGYGPQTVHFIGGQMYIDWPSMPLIPAYTADVSGNLSGSAEECGQDPYLGEIGLDFSMMAPLPHNLQRASEQGVGFTDLLGIAPGASYRLIVPRTLSDPANTDIVAALLAAATQNPRPNVITASLGFGEDQFGFSSRYLEDDPLTQAVIAAIVQSYHIVVCISSGDGTRRYTNTSIGPSGGSVPTELALPGSTPTDLNDVAFSGAPSRDFDSGAIDVGGTTLDDIFSAPPQNTAFNSLHSQHAFAETRWNGFKNFSSGFGSRVNVSAPSDNVLALSYNFGNFDSVVVGLSGGTSASAPEAAAAAAVVMQVAKLVGHPFATPMDTRSFLTATAAAVPNVSQADAPIHIGPQIDLENAIETLLKRNGAMKPAVARVAIEQRRNFDGNDAQAFEGPDPVGWRGSLDGAFLSDTDSGNIDLLGPVSLVDGSNTGRNQNAWITIAPDWEALPPGASFRLILADRSSASLATTRWARLLPEQILNLAGLQLVSSTTRTVKLRYQALSGAHLLAEAIVPLTFGPADATTEAVLAPSIPSVAIGATIPVKFDLTHAKHLNNPTLIVSRPGRVEPSSTGSFFKPEYSMPLSGLQGTVRVPISALEGGGIYGVGIRVGTLCCVTDPYTGTPGTQAPFFSDFAFTRVGGDASARPAAPLLSVDGVPPSHSLQISYGRPFRVAWDVSNVRGATGALFEIGAPGPVLFGGSLNTFNNPNGTIRDNNGNDNGSIYTVTLSGTSGTTTIDPVRAGLYTTFGHVVRVIPMRGGVAVGEGGDVSFITMDGVAASDGGFPNGFGVNPNGVDGYLGSAQGTASGGELSSIETFEQGRLQITGTAANESSATGDYLFALGNGVYAKDTGIYGNRNFPPNANGFNLFNLLNPIATGTTKPWSPPLTKVADPTGVGQIFSVAGADGSSDEGAFLTGRYTNTGLGVEYYVLGANVPGNTFGTAYDVTSALGPCTPYPTVGTCYGYTNIALDTETNQAILVSSDFANYLPPRLLIVNLIDGTTTSFAGADNGRYLPTFIATAVDGKTGKVGTITDSSAFTVYDLATKASKSIRLASVGMQIAVDPIRHLFLVGIVTENDRKAPPNNNQLSPLRIYDENANLLSSTERFNYDGSFVTEAAGSMQLNPSRRTGYMTSAIGMTARDVQLFKY